MSYKGIIAAFIFVSVLCLSYAAFAQCDGNCGTCEFPCSDCTCGGELSMNGSFKLDSDGSFIFIDDKSTSYEALLSEECKLSKEEAVELKKVSIKAVLVKEEGSNKELLKVLSVKVSKE